MRILIADDDPLFPEELAELLRSEGHGTRAVTSADEAISALEAEWFDVLLTDLRMPRKSGTVLLDEVARRWPGVRSIILSGQPSDEAIASSLGHGAFNFIGKPFQLAELTWALSVVADDLEEGRRVAPPWDPEGLSVAVRAALGRPVVLWGSPLAGLPGASTEPAADGPRGGPAPTRVLHLGAGPGEAVDMADLLRQTAERVRATEGATPLVVVADRRTFPTSALFAVWAVLAGRPLPRELAAAQGPKRREILRRLTGRELELEAIRREVPLPGLPGRLRLYLEHLVAAGLIHLRAGRYGLTRSGREVVDLLAALDAARGQLPPDRFLFCEEPVPPASERRPRSRERT